MICKTTFTKFNNLFHGLKNNSMFRLVKQSYPDASEFLEYCKYLEKNTEYKNGIKTLGKGSFSLAIKIGEDRVLKVSKIEIPDYIINLPEKLKPYVVPFEDYKKHLMPNGETFYTYIQLFADTSKTTIDDVFDLFESIKDKTGYRFEDLGKRQIGRINGNSNPLIFDYGAITPKKDALSDTFDTINVEGLKIDDLIKFRKYLSHNPNLLSNIPHNNIYKK